MPVYVPCLNPTSCVGVRSARFRPNGYKPPPTRKISPAAGGLTPNVRKNSLDSLARFNGTWQYCRTRIEGVSVWTVLCAL